MPCSCSAIVSGAQATTGLQSLFGQSEWLATRVFIPVSLIVVVAGILLVIEGPWAFDQLWVLLGLAGFAATFLTGLLVIKPDSERIAADLARDGMTPGSARVRSARCSRASGSTTR